MTNSNFWKMDLCTRKHNEGWNMKAVRARGKSRVPKREMGKQIREIRPESRRRQRIQYNWFSHPRIRRTRHLPLTTPATVTWKSAKKLWQEKYINIIPFRVLKRGATCKKNEGNTLTYWHGDKQGFEPEPNWKSSQNEAKSRWRCYYTTQSSTSC